MYKVKNIYNKFKKKCFVPTYLLNVINSNKKIGRQVQQNYINSPETLQIKLKTPLCKSWISFIKNKIKFDYSDKIFIPNNGLIYFGLSKCF